MALNPTVQKAAQKAVDGNVGTPITRLLRPLLYSLRRCHFERSSQMVTCCASRYNLFSQLESQLIFCDVAVPHQVMVRWFRRNWK
jgi:hypothetical protein